MGRQENRCPWLPFNSSSSLLPSEASLFCKSPTFWAPAAESWDLSQTVGFYVLGLMPNYQVCPLFHSLPWMNRLFSDISVFFSKMAILLKKKKETSDMKPPSTIHLNMNSLQVMQHKNYHLYGILCAPYYPRYIVTQISIKLEIKPALHLI